MHAGGELEKRFAWVDRAQALAALKATRPEQTPDPDTAHRAHNGDEHNVVVERIQLSASALRETQTPQDRLSLVVDKLEGSPVISEPRYEA